jgi:hypothetical protein
MARTLSPITSIADLLAFVNVSTDQELSRLEMVWKATEAEIRRYCGQNIAQPAAAYVDILPESDWYIPVDPLLSHDNVVPGGLGLTWSSGPQADGHLLTLRQGLVRSITSVYVDTTSAAGTSVNDFAAATLLDADTYFLDAGEKDPDDSLMSRSGIVVRRDANWPSRRRSVKVTYVAGLTAAELDDEFSDIRLAVVKEVVDKYSTVQSLGQSPIQSERLADWSITYAIGGNTDGLSLSAPLRSTLQPFCRWLP